MAEKDHLTVWYGKRLVGKLWPNQQGEMSFCYEKAWLQDGFAISQQLPLNDSDFNSETDIAHRFFANLLPEANARTHIVRDLKIANSDYALLRAIGGECAGALSILPA